MSSPRLTEDKLARIEESVERALRSPDVQCIGQDSYDFRNRLFEALLFASRCRKYAPLLIAEVRSLRAELEEARKHG